MGAIIGITADLKTLNEGKKGRHDILYVKKALADAVAAAGGTPVIVPFATSGFFYAKKIMDKLDGLLISGGDFDIDPAVYGEKRHKKLGLIKQERTLSEIFLLKAALKMNKPLLGICGGQQLINVHFGGTLYQDIPGQNKAAKDHEQDGSPTKASHMVKILDRTKLARIVKNKTLKVNSTHHQAVKELGKTLAASALSPDGIIEAVESRDGRFILGVQWHPEFLVRYEPHLMIFKKFVKACS